MFAPPLGKWSQLSFVSAGIGQDTTFMTFYRKPSGALRRFVAYGNALPPRNTREAAQADLDAYAQARGLKPAGGEAGV